ncbi:MAG: phage integrase SAM-like domain-containing protein [Bacteroidaceae bacterium]|nr:phage integrase SAM-like domain-containing protein [Bacteroidaceae bacterium]
MGVSIKLCYRPSAVKGKDGTLYYQIIIKRTTHTYASAYRIYPNEWDKLHGRILTNSSLLIKIKNRIDWEMQQIYTIAKRHIDKGTLLDFGGIISEFEELNRQQSFSGFLLSQAERLAQMGRTRTSETYISALHSFIKFYNEEDIMLYEITAEVMEDYERYLKNR